MTRPSVADKRRAFRTLHQSGCFVIPNPWDVGSARYLQGVGFKALASTSSGFAWSVAHADNAVGVDMVLVAPTSQREPGATIDEQPGGSGGALGTVPAARQRTSR